MPQTSTGTYDALVIGGGAAGLAAAVALARSLRSVAVIDAGKPRNAPAEEAHNLLGREGISPLQLVAIGREEAQSYGAQIISGEVQSVTRTEFDRAEPYRDTTFDATLTDGTTLCARRLLLASGLVDELPDIAGIESLWGTDVLHCPFCHGYEVRGRRIGILGTGPATLHQTLLFRQLSPHITVIDHGMPPLSDDDRAMFDALGVEYAAGPVARLDTDTSGRLRAAVFADGSEVELDALVVAPRFLARTALYESLGGEPTATPTGVFIPTEMGGRTPLAGVWAAGNCADPMAMVGAAAAAGTQAGAMINADLAMTDARRTVGSAAA